MPFRTLTARSSSRGYKCEYVFHVIYKRIWSDQASGKFFECSYPSFASREAWGWWKINGLMSITKITIFL